MKKILDYHWAQPTTSLIRVQCLNQCAADVNIYIYICATTASIYIIGLR